MDVIELLKKDHEKVSDLFREYKGGDVLTRLVKKVTGSGPKPGRRSVAERICHELDVHTRVEEGIFYPAVRATGDEKLVCLVDEGIKEHGQVKERIARLRQGSLDDEAYDAEVSQLEDDVHHHVNEEESDMFPRLEEMMGEEARADLGRRVQERKRALGGNGARTTRRVVSSARTSTATATRTTRRSGKPAPAKAKTKVASRKKARAKSGKR
jgi:iron-sulfur cluster repair protein YtfE (RIC family)